MQIWYVYNIALIIRKYKWKIYLFILLNKKIISNVSEKNGYNII